MTDSSTINRTILPILEIQHPITTPVDARKAPQPKKIEPLRPPQAAPNILIVLVDDMGFGASSAFGGPCAMPVAEQLAANGLKYTRFHTTALCSPTRAALLTGRNHHTVNMGSICETATAMPGYSSVRPDSCATIAQMLKLNGYNTAAFGKMHQTPTWEMSDNGPFDRWPTGEGFEKFYGFIGGEANQWAPALIEGTTPVATPDDPNYHLSEDLTDRVIAYIRQQKALTPDKPFFVYLSFGATHAPHHVPKPWMEKYKGKFDHGWDKQREMTVAKQQELGIVPPDCQLTQRHEEISAWDSLSDDERTVATRLMECYAGFAEHTDDQVRRVMDTLNEIGIMEDTLIFYMLGDNGASGEGGLSGSLNEIGSLNGVHDTTENILARLDEIGGPTAYNHYPFGWAHCMNAPYQWTKQIASHWGGTRCGMIVHYPAGIQAKGEVRHQWHHVIDIAPTILEIANLPQPVSVNGVPQHPIEGVSLEYSFDDATAPDQHVTQYFEIAGYRAIYHEGWSACTRHGQTVLAMVGIEPIPFDEDVWELYGPDDWSQAKNIADQNSAKLRELQQLFLIEGAKYNVFPLDDRKVERFNSDLAGRPDLMAGRTSLTLYPGMSHLNENTVPNVKNKSYTVTTEIDVPEDAKGAIIAQGGRFGGWSLYMKDGMPSFCSNWLDRERYYVRADAPLSAGKHILHYAFAYDGGGVGKGGTGTLYVDDRQVAQGRIEHTASFVFAQDDYTDIGKDAGSPVTDEYGVFQGNFTGKIGWVKIDIDQDVHEDPVGKQKALMVRQ